jgi:Peptidase inhibitor family I36
VHLHGAEFALRLQWSKEQTIMAIMRVIGSLVSTTMLFAPTLNAQFRGAGEIPRDGVCFYQDSNYRGPYFCVEAGSNLNSLPSDVRNQISSIRILGSTEVTVFQETNFRGPSSRFDSDVQSLARTGWNDMISSVRVRSSGFGGGAGGGRPPSFLNPDQIVRRAYQDILERDPDPAGLRAYRSRIVDDGWTEQQVREALRASPEYRERSTMTRAKAEDIVRRAYLSVLRREPDPGSRGYVDRVLSDRWTQQDVERELRNSAEYRQR